MPAYYNEHDPFAAQWLRNLIAAGHIAPGDVDERSIVDVRPADLRGYDQCHFFAGIGVWSYALRRAGWPDDRAVWTGSCPCQPFSAAGKGGGFADERHLWPAFYHLIAQCEPRVVFGEQVASKDGLAWLDLVYADLEAAHYAVGAVDLCAAGVGAPHIRQRLWWVADADEAGLGKQRCAQLSADSHASRGHDSDGCGEARGLADANVSGHGWRPRSDTPGHGRAELPAQDDRLARGLGDTGSARAGWDTGATPSAQEGVRGARGADGGDGGNAPVAAGAVGGLGSTDDAGLEGRRLSAQRARELFAGQTGVAGHWSDADWLYCRDGKWRPVEPGAFPLVDGAPARVGRLRGYGNAINAEVAINFIEAYCEVSE